MEEKETHKVLVVFQDKKIRRIWHNDEWWFSVVDVVAALADSLTPRQYWGKVKDREFTKIELYPNWVQFELLAADGKYSETDCANTKNLFCIIQSIPSPKAEPFKQWLAQILYEHIEEIQDPELVQKRIKEIYGAKALINGTRLYHNFIKPHGSLGGMTPRQKANIDINLNKNKWLSLLKESVKNE